VIWFAAAFAADHDPVSAPVRVTVAAGVVPSGPPREVSVSASEPLQDVIRGLPSGSTVHLRSGRHAGPVLLDRPLTLIGEPGATIDGGGTGSVLLIAAADVTVRDLRVTGGGHLPQNDDSGVVVAADRVVLERLIVDHAYIGIDLRMANDGIVRGCTVEGDPTAAFGLRGDGIRLWESDHNTVVANRLSHVRDLVVWYSNGNVFTDNEVVRSRYGTHLMHSDDTTIEDNTYDHDVVGVFVMYSSRVVVRRNLVTGSHGGAGVGLGFKESDVIRVEDNVLADGTTGIYLDTTPHDLGGEAQFTRNLLAANDVGVRFHGPSSGALFSGNAFVSNRVQASSDERGRTTNARFEGNHWSDYSGYDLDRDGVGDLPYEVRSASGRLLDRTPALTWLTGSPALALIDLFVAAFPMFAPESVVSDPRPLVTDSARAP
jgi:nitrous oxidase accessory protein